MLIKVLTHENTFTIFDNAEQISFDDRSNTIRSAVEFDLFIREVAYSEYPYSVKTSFEPVEIHYLNTSRDFDNPKTSDGYQVYAIKFKRGDSWHVVLFDDVAYICDDNGKTINRVGQAVASPITATINWTEINRQLNQGIAVEAA